MAGFEVSTEAPADIIKFTLLRQTTPSVVVQTAKPERRKRAYNRRQPERNEEDVCRYSGTGLPGGATSCGGFRNKP